MLVQGILAGRFKDLVSGKKAFEKELGTINFNLGIAPSGVAGIRFSTASHAGPAVCTV